MTAAPCISVRLLNRITADFVIDRTVPGDLDADGDMDEVLLLGHDPGGSGTLYYIAAPLNREGKYRGTNSILLGDRIIFQNLVINKWENYSVI